MSPRKRSTSTKSKLVTKRTKKETSSKEPTDTQMVISSKRKLACLQTRCSVSYFSGRMKALKPVLSSACVSKLRTTPFYRFLDTSHFHINIVQLKGILDSMSMQPLGLKVGVVQNFLPLSKEHISLVVG